MVEHARGTLGRTAFQLGVLERALELTAEYAREREQFDRPIGSFQAVAQRLADGYIDVKGLRLTLTQAAWRLAENLPADVDVATAAFWAADAGPPRRAHHGARARRRRESTWTTRCTGTSWPPSRPSSRSAGPPGSCCASAASWPTPPLDRERPSGSCWSRWPRSTIAASTAGTNSSAGATTSGRARPGRHAARAARPGQAAAYRCAAGQYAVLLDRPGGRRPDRVGAGRPEPDAPRRGTGCATSRAPTASWCLPTAPTRSRTVSTTSTWNPRRGPRNWRRIAVHPVRSPISVPMTCSC